MYPNMTITIKKGGKVILEGDEKSPQCHKISDLAKASGKVISDDEKEHTPVYQDVSQVAK